MLINMGPTRNKRRRGMGGETVTEAPSCAICLDDFALLPRGLPNRRRN
uniref:RING-type domain-containing protein n=1 Tax=Setaria italica TaxID=4555 RepID=K3YF36_SETIT